MDFMPITFHLGSCAGEERRLKEAVGEFVEFFSYVQEHTTLANVWMVKPIGMNQGRGIFMFRGFGELVKGLKKGRGGGGGGGGTGLCQGIEGEVDIEGLSGEVDVDESKVS